MNHTLPQWYDDAKLGIFIHWGLFSVPAYAPVEGKNFTQMVESQGMPYQLKHNPYAEWYLNSLRIEGSPTQIYHIRSYGKDFSYTQFQPLFEQASRHFDMEEWTDLIEQSGARYSVLVTKHHDGFCLWPSRIKNPNNGQYQSRRDFVNEFVTSLRKRNIHPGLYYSGIYDWTFKKFPIADYDSMMRHLIADPAYAAYSYQQWQELIHTYKPDILWNDIGMPSGIDLDRFFEDYYNQVSEGVVNDRWNQISLTYRSTAAEIHAYALAYEASMKSEQPMLTHSTTHHDYVTPEYRDTTEIQTVKFELTRGLGYSFGYNKMEAETDTLSAKELIYLLLDVVSKNGNLLINMGPKADGSIPEMQKKALLGLGQWLKTNGEAVYGTRPWIYSSAMTNENIPIRYTRKENHLYASLLCDSLPDSIVIPVSETNIHSVKLLGYPQPLSFAYGSGLLVHLPPNREKQAAYVLKIETA